MRKINLLKWTVLIIVLFMFNFCSKDNFQTEQVEEVQNYTADELRMIEQYNQDVSLFAQAISKSLHNDDFRKLVKSEAIKQFDGDYDILLKRIVDIQLNSNNSKSNYTVKNLLEENHPLFEETNNKSGNSLIDDLQEQYPDLQIAVPIHAEDWDANSYIPDVTYIPGDFDETTTQTLVGYTSEGNINTLDAVNEPDVPVIVIGLNERIMSPNPGGSVESPTPFDLIGSTNENGIHLSWSMPSEASYSNTNGYNIYRKTSEENNFKKYAEIYGVYNKSYNDNNVTPNESYEYYVTSFYMAYESPGTRSETVKAPDVPASVESFDAIYDYPGEVELRWDNPAGVYYEHTNVNRKILGVNSQYINIVQLPFNTVNYMDLDNITGGKTIKYQIRQEVNGYQSNANYDMVKVPYRDVSQKSSIYIKKISFNYSDFPNLEPWAMGRPEFLIKIFNVDEDPSADAVEIASTMCSFTKW
ncbi:MAG: hypothetical protein GXO79_08640, partial [Chlorobi bacterium]|nr:hypothetical protein [Chlorobiota bacterium]